MSGQVFGDACVGCHGCSFVLCSAVVLCCVGLGFRGVPRIFVGRLRDLCVCFVRSFGVFCGLLTGGMVFCGMICGYSVWLFGYNG